jgi:multidrug resistance efflux pump
MRKTLVVMAVLVLSVGVAVFAVQRFFFDSTVVATGYLQPVSVTELNFAVNAPITEVLVRQDQIVLKGQVLARQDTSALEAQLGAHSAALAADQAALAYQQDPLRPAELQGLQLAASSAQTQVDLAQAKAAQTVGVDNSVVVGAANDIDSARAVLASDQQQAALIASSCGSVTSQSTASASASAAADPHTSDTTPITLPPITAPPPDVATINACNQIAHQIVQDQTRVTEALGAYDIAVAKRQLNAQTVGETIASAQLQVQSAVSRQAIGTLPATPANLAVAQAAVAQDTVEVAQAQRSIDDAVIVAPADGIVSSVGGEVGEVAGPQGVRVFASPSALPEKSGSGIHLFPSGPKQPTQQAEQYNSLVTLGSRAVEVVAQVGESDLHRVHSGQRVTITFPALPNESYVGLVERLVPQAVNVDGDVFFLVELSLPRQPQTQYSSSRQTAVDASTTAQSQRVVGLTADVRF